MDSTNEIVHDLFPLLRVYKDGRVERCIGTDVVPASVDPATGVQSKDVTISPEIELSARLYIPKSANQEHKLPLLIYIHGGGFVVETAFSPAYHNHLSSLVAESNIIAVSVNYRKAPEHPLPIAYDDSWAAVKWVASHSSGDGPEPWLKEYADFRRVFFAGDSAGANIAHNLAIRVGSGFGLEELGGLNLEGVVLVHSYFWGKDAVGGECVDITAAGFAEKLWLLVNPGTSGFDDPLINPGFDPRLSSLGCKRVLLFVAEKDGLRERGWYYKEVLGKSGWGGTVEVMETKGEGHVFHLFNPTSENAVALVKSMASFINVGKTL